MNQTVINDSCYLSSLEWRSIPGWLEYEVSELGHVRRVGKGQGTRSGRLLKAWINSQTGYVQVQLWKKNSGRKFTTHRLVALAFIGLPPSPKHVVAHHDGSRTNNHWLNLRWATFKENSSDTLGHGTRNHGEKNGQSKLDEVCVVAIRRMVSGKIPRLFVADGFGICRQTVDDIAKGRRWGHLVARERLPNRRPNETTTLVFGGMSFAVTIGFFPANDRPGEVFASGAKSGCDLDYLLDDACVALSLLLQHGVQPAALAKSMGRTGDGTTPASIIGALADRLGEIAAQNAPRESTGGPRRASGDGAAPIHATGQSAPGESLTASARAEVA